MLKKLAHHLKGAVAKVGMALMLTATAGTVALPLTAASCTPQQVQQAETDALNVAQSLLNNATTLEGILSGGAKATLTTAVTKLQADVQTLQAAAAAAPSATVQAVVTGVNTILGLVEAAGVAIPSPVSTIIAAATTLLPLIEAAYNLVTGSAALAMRAKFAASASPMSVARARLIVAAYAIPS